MSALWRSVAELAAATRARADARVSILRISAARRATFIYALKSRAHLSDRSGAQLLGVAPNHDRAAAVTYHRRSR